MLGKYAIPVIASILILSTFAAGSFFEDAEAKKGDNNGNKGCENANPNSKACEKNPNTEPPDDTEPPIITASTAPPPNANGWNNSDVVISFECEDNEGGSGVASLTPDLIITTEGANQGFIGTCTDNEGNSATVTVFVRIDKTDPTGTVLINGGDATTNSQSVTLTITCLDFGSGCFSMQVAVDGTVDTEPVQGFASPIVVTLPAGDGTKTVAVIVIDRAGNPSAQVTDSIVLNT